MGRLIENLLTHHRAGWSSMEVQDVDLMDLALQVTEDHASAARRAGVHFDIAENLPTIRGDRYRLTAMLDNLIANAIKYGCAHNCPVRSRIVPVGYDRRRPDFRLIRV